MTGPPGGVPPPKEAAAQARTRAADEGKGSNGNDGDNSTDDADRLLKKAAAVRPGGELFEFLPEQPAWYRRMGDQVHRFIADQQLYVRIGLNTTLIELPSLDRKRLEFVCRLAEGRRRGAEIGAAYPPPTHASIDDARKSLADAFDDVFADTLAYCTSTTLMAA